MTERWRPYQMAALGSQLSARDLALIADVERFRLLDARLIQQLHFVVGPGGHQSVSAATRACNRVLTRLHRLGFISPLQRRIGGPNSGSGATVWQLAAAGERFLRARRGEPRRRRFVEPTHRFMEHTLEVAALAAQLRNAASKSDRDVLELDPEPACWRPYSDATGEAATLKPDLYVVTADEETESHAFVEVDRGTEHLPAVLRKCHVYQRYWSSGVEQSRTGLFPLVLWVTVDQRRASHIREAIADDPLLSSELFRVTTIEAAMALLLRDQSKGGST